MLHIVGRQWVPPPNSFGGALEGNTNHPQAALGGGTRDYLFVTGLVTQRARCFIEA